MSLSACKKSVKSLYSDESKYSNNYSKLTCAKGYEILLVKIPNGDYSGMVWNLDKDDNRIKCED